MNIGIFDYRAGTSGTVTPPKGAIVKQVYAHSSGAATVTIFGGQALPVVSGTAVMLRYGHSLLQARNDTTLAGSQDIVFTGTDSYYVDYYYPPGAPA